MTAARLEIGGSGNPPTCTAVIFNSHVKRCKRYMFIHAPLPGPPLSSPSSPALSLSPPLPSSLLPPPHPFFFSFPFLGSQMVKSFAQGIIAKRQRDMAAARAKGKVRRAFRCSRRGLWCFHRDFGCGSRGL